MQKIKKVLNIEKELDSNAFMEAKHLEVSSMYQSIYTDKLVKVLTFCLQDAMVVEHVSESGRFVFGVDTQIISVKGMDDFSVLCLDDTMLNMYELIVSKESYLQSFEDAVNAAQSIADEMFAKDPHKIPIVMINDHKFQNGSVVVSATDFGGKIGASDAVTENRIGDTDAGKEIVEFAEIGLQKVSIDEFGDGWFHVANVVAYTTPKKVASLDGVGGAAVVDDEKWQKLYDRISVGLLVVGSSGKKAFISFDKVKNLKPLPLQRDTLIIHEGKNRDLMFHLEHNGSDYSESDYSYVRHAGRYTVGNNGRHFDRFDFNKVYVDETIKVYVK